MRAQIRSLALATLVLGCCLPAAASAAAKLPALKLTTVGTFDKPTYVGAPPEDPRRIFVAEKTGRIRVVLDGRPLAAPFLDLRSRTYSDGMERGVLSVAFPPDYARSGVMYVAFTALNGDVTVEEYQRRQGNPNVADVSTRRTILVQHHPNHNHNSGQLQFGPDSKLYIGLGDGGGAGDKQGNGQNLLVKLGKILRVDPRAGHTLVPADNPFAASGSAAPEIYAYGFRNPWRFAFDRQTGALAIADVGQDEVEEVSYARKDRAAGRNFGWNACEGDQAFPPAGTPRKPCSLKGSVRPSIVLRHKQGYCSVIGGYVVRDRSLGRYFGRYLYGDWCKVGLRSARLGVPAAKRDDRAAGTGPVGLTSFGEDAGGCLYAASIVGTVSRIQAKPVKGAKTPTPGDGGKSCMKLKAR